MKKVSICQNELAYGVLYSNLLTDHKKKLKRYKVTTNAHFVYPIYYMKTKIVPHRSTIQNFGLYPHEIYDLFHQDALYGYYPLKYMIINIKFKKKLL